MPGTPLVIKSKLVFLFNDFLHPNKEYVLVWRSDHISCSIPYTNSDCIKCDVIRLRNGLIIRFQIVKCQLC